MYILLFIIIVVVVCEISFDVLTLKYTTLIIDEMCVMF